MIEWKEYDYHPYAGALQDWKKSYVIELPGTERALVFRDRRAAAEIRNLVVKARRLGGPGAEFQMKLVERVLIDIARRGEPVQMFDLNSGRFLGQLVRSEEPEIDHRPPATATLLLWFIPREKRANVLGDLEQGFHEACEHMDLRHARAAYWVEVLRTVLPMLVRRLEQIAKMGAVGWLLRHLG